MTGRPPTGLLPSREEREATAADVYNARLTKVRAGLIDAAESPWTLNPDEAARALLADLDRTEAEVLARRGR